MKQCVEVMYTGEISQHIDVLAPQISKEHFEVERIVPHECASAHKYSPQILVDVPVPQRFEVLAEKSV